MVELKEIVKVHAAIVRRIATVYDGKRALG
jgi:hypothetical protein